MLVLRKQVLLHLNRSIGSCTTSTVIQLRVRPEVTPTPALGDRTLVVPRKPLPRVVQVQDMFTLQTEGREPRGQLRRLGVRRSRGGV